MRKYVGITLLSLVGMMVLSGCGASGPAMPAFESNDYAISNLGNTSWGDAGGNFSLVFDSNAKITGFSLPAGTLPAELSNIRIDGQPFTVQLPADQLPPQLSGYAGKQYTATAENTKTILNPDGTMTIEFTALVAEIPQFLMENMTFSVTSQVVNGSQLTNLTASAVANTIAGPIPVFSGGVADTYSVSKL